MPSKNNWEFENTREMVTEWSELFMILLQFNFLQCLQIYGVFCDSMINELGFFTCRQVYILTLA